MNKLYEENHIQDIANAIRNKNVSGTFTVAEMAPAINNIQTGGTVEFDGILLSEEVYTSSNMFYSYSGIGYGATAIKMLGVKDSPKSVFNLGQRGVFITEDDDPNVLYNLLDNNLRGLRKDTFRDNLSLVYKKRSGTSGGVFDSIKFYPWCGPNITDMSYAYYNLREVMGSPVCGPNVTDMSRTYNSCFNLTGSPVVGPNVVNMAYAYSDCRNLTGSPVVGPKVRNMTYAYNNCTNLTGDLIIKNNALAISYAYSNCNNLNYHKEVAYLDNIGASLGVFDYGNVSAGMLVANNCDDLRCRIRNLSGSVITYRCNGQDHTLTGALNTRSGVHGEGAVITLNCSLYESTYHAYDTWYLLSGTVNTNFDLELIAGNLNSNLRHQENGIALVTGNFNCRDTSFTSEASSNHFYVNVICNHNLIYQCNFDAAVKWYNSARNITVYTGSSDFNVQALNEAIGGLL